MTLVKSLKDPQTLRCLLFIAFILLLISMPVLAQPVSNSGGTGGGSNPLSGISIAVASCVRVVVMAELLGANNGVGAQIADARTMLDTGTVMAYVILVIVLVSLFEYLIIKPLEILFMPWKH